MNLIAQSNLTFKVNDSPLEALASITGAIAVFTIIITAIVHIAFALAVYADARRINTSTTQDTVFVREFIWSIWVLITGPLGAGLYWAIHHSTLRRNEGDSAQQSSAARMR